MIIPVLPQIQISSANIHAVWPNYGAVYHLNNATYLKRLNEQRTIPY